MTKAIQQSKGFCQVCLAVAGILLLLSAGLNGHATASDVSVLKSRPATVPAEYVITPFGYFHPSCVQMLAEGSTLLADGGIRRADGTKEAAQVCAYPHYSPGGAIAAGAKTNGANPEEIEGYLEVVLAEANSSYYKIDATWLVPPTPISNDGQVIYFFPGFEATNEPISILQPVLQWGNSGAFGGPYWLVASWNCCINGTTWYSTPLNVNVGDTIHGAIASTCKPGKKYCAAWNVVSEDVTTGEKTTLAKTPAEGEIWNVAFAAATEDYNVAECSDFPDNSELEFTVGLYDQSGKVIDNPGWFGYVVLPNPTPRCHYGTKVSKTKETLKY